jgi:hypothetical protein
MKFTCSPAYPSFTANLREIAQEIKFHHVTPIQFPPTILSIAPCIEYVTFYDVEPGFLECVVRFGEQVKGGKVDGFWGWGAGKVVEALRKGGDLGGEEENAIVLWL